MRGEVWEVWGRWGCEDVWGEVWESVWTECEEVYWGVGKMRGKWGV